MVVRQRQRCEGARYELFAGPEGFYLVFGDTQDGHFRRVDDRREGGAAQAAEAGDAEAAAFHLVGFYLAIATAFGEVDDLFGNLPDRLLVGVFDHRNDQAVRGVDGDTDVDVKGILQRFKRVGILTWKKIQILFPG